ncbi:hypothetical protein [Nonomuraea sp. NPDC049400]|uniref:hypothetical protein n=1 Tax=Nonomuraea sp. NPDC049400 TaxID=3364352 RepID=UPI003795DC2F
MYILIADLNDAGLPHGEVHFGPCLDDDSEVATAAVHAWARAHGYVPDKGEVLVTRKDVTEVELHGLHLHDASERSAPGRFNGVAVNDKAALRALS